MRGWSHANMSNGCPEIYGTISGAGRRPFVPRHRRVRHDGRVTTMAMGANIPIPVPAVRAALHWTGGPGIPDVDASALLLLANGQVGSDADFVFYNQAQHASGAVRMAGQHAAAAGFGRRSTST